MACYHPSRVSIKRKSLGVGACRVRDTVTVPCGHCLGCRTDQARGWAVRLVHEGVVSWPAWFVTLTYSPERISEYGSLAARDIQLFIKKLRRVFEGERISYYVAGEYGEVTSRPHYHAVLYGARFLDRVEHAVRHGAPVFRSRLLEDTWSHGLCEFTGLTYGAARYCAAYVRKKVRSQEYPEHYDRVDEHTGEVVRVAREFSRMSLRPAIGRRWIERYWREVYPVDRVVMDGRELKPPRYYDKWLEKYQPETFLKVWEKRQEEELVELSAQELEAAEAVHVGRVSIFSTRRKV